MVSPLRLLALLAALLGSLVAAPTVARAQECISCRSQRCPGNVWLDKCQSAASKPTPKATKPAKAAPVEPPAGSEPPRSPAVSAADECTIERPLQLNVDLPRTLYEGDLFGLRVRSSCAAHLVLLYVEESGEGAVLWPSQLERDPIATPREPALLPSRREAKQVESLKATLRAPGQISKERLIVLGFGSRKDWERLRPALDATQISSYLTTLEAGAAALPRHAFTKLDLRYQILPRGKGR